MIFFRSLPTTTVVPTPAAVAPPAVAPPRAVAPPAASVELGQVMKQLEAMHRREDLEDLGTKIA